jgi:hypothetical protein
VAWSADEADVDSQADEAEPVVTATASVPGDASSPIADSPTEPLTTAWPGEPTAWPGEPTAWPGEPTARSGEPAAWPGEPAAWPGEPAAWPGDIEQVDPDAAEHEVADAAPTFRHPVTPAQEDPEPSDDSNGTSTESRSNGGRPVSGAEAEADLSEDTDAKAVRSVTLELTEPQRPSDEDVDRETDSTPPAAEPPPAEAVATQAEEAVTPAPAVAESPAAESESPAAESGSTERVAETPVTESPWTPAAAKPAGPVPGGPIDPAPVETDLPATATTDPTADDNPESGHPKA